MSASAVVVEDVSKMFRLYKERNNSLKATLMRGRRAAVVSPAPNEAGFSIGVLPIKREVW